MPRVGVLLGGVVSLFGYAVAWLGYATLKGSGAPGLTAAQNVGLLDLLLPSRITATKGKVAQLPNFQGNAAQGIAPGSTLNPNGTVTRPAAPGASAGALGKIVGPAVSPPGPTGTPTPAPGGSTSSNGALQNIFGTGPGGATGNG